MEHLTISVPVRSLAVSPGGDYGITATMEVEPRQFASPLYDRKVLKEILKSMASNEETLKAVDEFVDKLIPQH